ncbi:ferritin-like domain-containing protein [Insolitispirillum peregrinum]|uniref:ferritin-like domain-containing protein n=1 Tax=Insolitispirillum peregrinum TaxID=80876 RepID=UPI003616741F
MITTVPEFLAHAITLERESAERFDELADALEVHHNGDVVELFRKMAHYSRLHLAEARDAARGLTLPHYAPWEYHWPDAESPETVEIDEVHYRMTPHHALIAAKQSEERGHAFYALIASTCPNAEVQAMAAEFAAEEQMHIRLLLDWLKKYPPPGEHWAEDLDPPVSVD